MKDSVVVTFLYKTVVGRAILKLLVHPEVSNVSAKFLSSHSSRWLVPIFVQKNRIDMACYKEPKGGYKSFNDFFTRKKDEKYIWSNEGELVSPCDGLLTVSEINDDSVFNIKHTQYSLSELLKSKELADEYKGGTAFVFRLTPSHYHRYIWSCSGYLSRSEHIEGILHSVQPVCHEKTKVFVQNTREYTLINTSNVGEIVQMEIGALLVGRISNHENGLSRMVFAGQEKGFFEYGGSSIVVLTNERMEISEELMHRERIRNEIPVVMGEKLVR